MSHPTETIIKTYEGLKAEFACAIRAAGGEPQTILTRPEWISVLALLVANNISIEATFEGVKVKE